MQTFNKTWFLAQFWYTRIYKCFPLAQKFLWPVASINSVALKTLSSNIGLAETALLDIMAANVNQQRLINQQLRREAEIPRISVSESCEILMKYMSEHENEDCLLTGFSSQKLNPFREKSSCSVL